MALLHCDLPTRSAIHPVCCYISLCSVLLITCQANTFQQSVKTTINKFISSVGWCVCACAHWDYASSWPEPQQHPCTALRCRGSSGTSCLDHTQAQRHLQLLLWVFCCAFCSASASIHLPAGLAHCAVIHPKTCTQRRLAANSRHNHPGCQTLGSFQRGDCQLVHLKHMQTCTQEPCQWSSHTKQQKKARDQAAITYTHDHTMMQIKLSASLDTLQRTSVQ